MVARSQSGPDLPSLPLQSSRGGPASRLSKAEHRGGTGSVKPQGAGGAQGPKPGWDQGSTVLWVAWRIGFTASATAAAPSAHLERCDLLPTIKIAIFTMQFYCSMSIRELFISWYLLRCHSSKTWSFCHTSVSLNGWDLHHNSVCMWGYCKGWWFPGFFLNQIIIWI